MIHTYKNIKPVISPKAFLAENATIIGDVSIGAYANVWYGAVLRGDRGAITIGERCAVEDNVVIHAQTMLGHDVVVGHAAILHGCVVEDGALIGMGATVLNDAHIGKGAVVAAGALVPKGMKIPAGALALGVPAQVTGTLTQEQRESFEQTTTWYVETAQEQLIQYGDMYV